MAVIDDDHGVHAVDDVGQVRVFDRLVDGVAVIGDVERSPPLRRIRRSAGSDIEARFVRSVVPLRKPAHALWSRRRESPRSRREFVGRHVLPWAVE